VDNNARAPGRRSQAEAVRTRRRILDRAERLFARRGYRGVSVRELARSAGVRPFTVQHHFGSKLALYRELLSRWDAEVVARLSAILARPSDLPDLVERVVDELFEFFLAKRDWVALTRRASLGEGLPKGVSLEEHGWLRFVDGALQQRRLGSLPFDPGLLLITVEGLLHHHVLSDAHYRQLFGRDLGDAPLRARTKRHLKSVILALVGPAPGSAAA
jgi:AcrR family transcriptional regulator